MMTRVIHHSARHLLVDNYVYIGRPSPWGNPFKIGADGTREDVIAKYTAWIQTQPHLLAALPTLKNKTLGCWCKPQACHGDVLARLADTAQAPQKPAEAGTVEKGVSGLAVLCDAAEGKS
jgi:hypothetical protein